MSCVPASIANARNRPKPSGLPSWRQRLALRAMVVTAQTIWNAYGQRWPIEPGVRSREESLGWNLPHFHSAAIGDTWTLLIVAAHWMLFLARPIVEDALWPWQEPQRRLTPQRVRQSLKPIFVLIGSPACAPKPRDKAPGWPQGMRRTPKERYKVVKKGVTTTLTA